MAEILTLRLKRLLMPNFHFSKQEGGFNHLSYKAWKPSTLEDPELRMENVV